MFVGKEAFASLSYEQVGLASWTATNGDFLGYTVKQIDKNFVLLAEPGTAKEFKITLAGSKINTLVGEQAGPKPYTKAWINSTANPMLMRMDPLPLELYRNWSKLTDTERAEVIAFYRNHGWRIILAETIGETTNFAWENIYEAERIAVVKANGEAFEKSLAPEQLEIWKRLKSGGFVRAVGGKHTPEQEKLIAEARKAHANFQSTLTPAQRALFDGIPDFTKANWNE